MTDPYVLRQVATTTWQGHCELCGDDTPRYESLADAGDAAREHLRTHAPRPKDGSE
jgi:hypothetical protein